MWFMCVDVCKYVCACFCVCIHEGVCMCAHVCIYSTVCVRMCVYTVQCVCVCVCVCVSQSPLALIKLPILSVSLLSLRTCYYGDGYIPRGNSCCVPCRGEGAGVRAALYSLSFPIPLRFPHSYCFPGTLFMTHNPLNSASECFCASECVRVCVS